MAGMTVCPKYSTQVLICQRTETCLNIKYKVLDIRPEVCLRKVLHLIF